MRAIITGMNGTLAPFIYEVLNNRKIEVVIWDRNKIDISKEESVYSFVREIKPDLFFHIATGPVSWVESIAKVTKELKVKLLFTSSVSVFSEKGTGPYDITSVPDSQEEYGLYKIECENAVRTHNQESIILRLGWQIGDRVGSNNMFDFLAKQQSQNGYIEASSRWFPSCSFLKDTAETIVNTALVQPSGTYLANSNRKYSFYDIVNHLKKMYHTDWIVRESTSFVRDDRMTDERVHMKELF